LIANFRSFKLLDPSMELVEVRAVSTVWDLLDRPLRVHLVSGSDTPESEEDESSGGSLWGGKDNLHGGPPSGGSI